MKERAGPVLTGAGLAAAGWALGSTALLLAGIGIGAAGALSLLWVLAARRVRVDREVRAGSFVEGERITIAYSLRNGRWLPGTITISDSIGPLALPSLPLRRGRRGAVAHVTAPRGIHAVGPGRVVADDPFGFSRRDHPAGIGPTLRVRPRIVELEGTFRDAGRVGDGGRRARLRSAGTEPHGVREYREGESLRAVHWASSARRGRLMVREMEEAPHADTHVLVDLDSRCAAGPPGASSVDELVRIAGSLAHAELRRGRRVALVLCGATPVRVVISGLAGDWEAALDALTVAQVAERACTGDVLRRCETAVVLVSGRSPSVFGDELVRRDVAVVAVDTPTYAGAPRSQADPSLLRLAARGVPVAIVRSGDALEPVLSRPREHARA